jgi:PBP1b-binding outer membrane lipoprotein LpoB
LRGIFCLTLVAVAMFLVGCSGGDEKSPPVGEVATSPQGEADIKKNGIPQKGAGQTIPIDR